MGKTFESWFEDPTACLTLKNAGIGLDIGPENQALLEEAVNLYTRSFKDTSYTLSMVSAPLKVLRTNLGRPKDVNTFMNTVISIANTSGIRRFT